MLPLEFKRRGQSGSFVGFSGLEDGHRPDVLASMRVLVAFDKFKDALSARDACETAGAALKAMHPDWDIDPCPLTDGGDGFTSLLTEAAGGSIHTAEVSGPRGERVTASFGIINFSDIAPGARQRLQLEAGSTAPVGIGIVDMASASGLALLPKDARDPWACTSRGTGELLLAVAQLKPDVILLGIGGSATNDLGVGALQALGLSFMDGATTLNETLVPSRWGNVSGIGRTNLDTLPPVLIACDVDNRLLGPSGAAATFGPQKGLPQGDVERLDAASGRMAKLLCEHFEKPLSWVDAPGTGAAGGFAFGFMTALGARLVPGSELVADWLELPRRIAAADLVITGEGRFDAGSLRGKGPGAIVALAKRAAKPVHVFAGQATIQSVDTRVHQITPPETPHELALKDTRTNLAAAIRRHL